MSIINLFSPPYGDGTATFDIETTNTEFSPPYGDGTKSIRSIIKFAGVFAPLRGWYQKFLSEQYCGDVFAPLRGWYRITYNIYHRSTFSPPYGDGTLNISQNIVKWKS